MFAGGHRSQAQRLCRELHRHPIPEEEPPQGAAERMGPEAVRPALGTAGQTGV